MRRYITSLIMGTLMGAVLACQSAQEPTPTPMPTDLVHSTLIVQFPDVKAVAARSIVPTGALDQLVRKSVVQDSAGSGVYADSVRTQFLYNAAGQITGYQNFFFGLVATSEIQQQEQNRQSAYGVVYEYKNNRPYRIYSKAYNSMVRPYLDLFFMSEFVYENESAAKPTFKREYNVSPAGEATLSAQYELVYDQSGNLVEDKDVNQYFIHQRYTYQNNNIIKTETIDPKSTTSQSSHYEYEYDRQANPTRNLFWTGNYDYTEFTANANNVTQRRLIDSSPSLRPYIDDYTLDYDSRGRLVSRLTVTNSGSTRSTEWLYRYGQ